MKKYIRPTIISICVLIVLGYSIFAFRDIVRGPSIIINEPINGETYATSTIKVSGSGVRVKEIKLNGRPLIVDDVGNFSEYIVLLPGYNVELLEASDKFGRIIKQKLELIFKI